MTTSHLVAETPHALTNAHAFVDDRSASASLAVRYQAIRRFSEQICQPLAAEDYVIQSMPDASPTKWHMAHTSWFFETFVLKAALPEYSSLHPQYDFLFNSYYNSVGARHCRPKRGLISRPTVEEMYKYREYVDRHMLELLSSANDKVLRKVEPVVVLGLHHEQQHQELMLTDIKHVFAQNPLRPAYSPQKPTQGNTIPSLQWIEFDEGVREIGHAGDDFSFDNEGPRHREFVGAFQLANRLVTNGEYLAFIEDAGYLRPEFWLSMGWTAVQENKWKAPFYWEERDGQWWHMTLAGMRQVHENEPVCHVSYFEADAYAHWAAARLPTEAEWEVAANGVSINGNFADNGYYHPVPLSNEEVAPLSQMFGDVWEWTRSQYSPYPGYAPLAGALGEYNGKFMCNQYVLRGGSCATSRSHIRRTYRNFFPPDACWQFTGIRLAKDIS